MDLNVAFILGCFLAAVVMSQMEKDIQANDPFKTECIRRKIQCHSRAICRLDVVTETFYCQCIPGHNGDGVHFCQEPSAKITISPEQICDGTSSQLCVVKSAPGKSVQFSIFVEGNYDQYNIQWFKFYSSYGHTFYSYRKRLTSSSQSSANIQILNDGLIVKIDNVMEDDFFPNLFWAQLDIRSTLEISDELQPHEISSYEILNPSQLRFYFALDALPIDIGKYLTGDTIVIHLSSYMNVSLTSFVNWVKEPDNITLIHSVHTSLANSTNMIKIHDLQEEDFGKIRAVIYDYLPSIPGKVMVAQKLFVIRKDISKVCMGLRSVRHCKCNPGFKGNGIHCVDVDECKEEMAAQCLPHATCVNTYGSYICKCPNGYEGDGIYSCIDVDECFRGLAHCNTNASCMNTLGSYVCICPKGFFSRSGECRAKSIWTPWSPWSICSVTCGNQNQMRFRICTHPESGMRCLGPTADLKPCPNLRECPVNGQWSEWSPWSTCTQLCSGIKRRIRVCNNPPPSSNGQLCEGTPEETAACSSEHCPIDGSWSLWSAWRPCPVTCGLAVVSRSRICNSPSAQNGGKTCQGQEYEEATCGTPKSQCEHLTKTERNST
ncbi:uncharacterized protein LOC127528897 [Erpetoichthys calabaricus]|uniref:uncharacterized protein LOC127528897 n=1 Tax=Erpetoichthys calabaricus TaxID=27687 RepID=UPI0022348F39|nr:uncharacterized protein LOC127528897 [Erpetoichthys calabaricus]